MVTVKTALFNRIKDTSVENGIRMQVPERKCIIYLFTCRVKL
jgi:hypothetical protein